MKMYIRATENISAQKTFRRDSLTDQIVSYAGIRMNCIEPDYKDFIDSKMIRRMSRIIKMGVASAISCLQKADITTPGAIITGTAYGCLQDTDIFLTKLVEQKEELLTPTAFIQSTHNTIGAQVGLMLKSNQYNNTFVHRGSSFESALLDGIMLLMENPAFSVLVGAIDEITDKSHAILKRFDLYKDELLSKSNLDLYQNNSKGTIAGEGAAFFLLSNEASENDYAKLDGLYSFYKPSNVAQIEEHIKSFLSFHSLTVDDIDLLITGKNGDNSNDVIYESLADTIFAHSSLVNYKNLCGEYPTSAAFAFWLAAGILKTGNIPQVLKDNRAANKVQRILIYNYYQNKNHSLFLLSAC